MFLTPPPSIRSHGRRQNGDEDRKTSMQDQMITSGIRLLEESSASRSSIFPLHCLRTRFASLLTIAAYSLVWLKYLSIFYTSSKRFKDSITEDSLRARAGHTRSKFGLTTD